MPCVHNKHKHKAALATFHYYLIKVRCMESWLTALITINLNEKNQAFSGFLFLCKYNTITTKASNAVKYYSKVHMNFKI